MTAITKRWFWIPAQTAHTKRNNVMSITCCGAPSLYRGPKKNWLKNLALNEGRTMLGRNWLDYDIVVLALLVSGLGAVDLLALSL